MRERNTVPVAKNPQGPDPNNVRIETNECVVLYETMRGSLSRWHWYQITFDLDHGQRERELRRMHDLSALLDSSNPFL